MHEHPVANWNLPAGTRVNVVKDNGEVVRTVTRSEPWQLGHGAWVVLLEGFSGGFALERVSPILPRFDLDSARRFMRNLAEIGT